jgi:hypothetical protein
MEWFKEMIYIWRQARFSAQLYFKTFDEGGSGNALIDVIQKEIIFPKLSP